MTGDMTGMTRRAVLTAGAGLLVCGVPEIAFAADEKPLKAVRRVFGVQKKIEFTTHTTVAGLSNAKATKAVNLVRAARGRSPVRHHGLLHQAAQWQAREMARRDEFAHQLGPGLSLKDRVRRTGYKGIMAENLARTYETLEEALLAWLKSPSHRTTLLSERYTQFGVGAATVPRSRESEYRYYWAIIFGKV